MPTGPVLGVQATGSGQLWIHPSNSVEHTAHLAGERRARRALGSPPPLSRNGLKWSIRFLKAVMREFEAETSRPKTPSHQEGFGEICGTGLPDFRSEVIYFWIQNAEPNAHVRSKPKSWYIIL